jgi:hypothetical protein
VRRLVEPGFGSDAGRHGVRVAGTVLGMRHLGSLLAGLVVAPLVWVLIAAGQPRTAQTFVRWRDLDSVYTGDLLRPLGLLAAAGLLTGLVLALRLSPVGPLVAGVAYLAMYGFAFVDPFRVIDVLPQININGYRIDTTVPFTNGTMALIGVALVAAALSRRRWQRWPAAAGAGEAAGAAGAAGAGAAGAGAPEVPVSPTPVTAEQTQPEVPPAVGPLPPVAAAPLWPAAAAASAPGEFAMSPGTAEDLPRRSPPKRPESPAPQPDARGWNEQPGGPVDGWPVQDGWPEPRAVSWPGAAPVIPGPRHATADDDHPGPIQPTFRIPPSGPPDDDAPSFVADEGDRPRPTPRPDAAPAGPAPPSQGDATQPLGVQAQGGPPQGEPHQTAGSESAPQQAEPPQAGPPASEGAQGPNSDPPPSPWAAPPRPTQE